jgi:hypothetical protein
MGLIRRPRRAHGRRRRRFSLNALAIQLSAFALSFTLVALLVVSGSQAAFVEENESVTNYVPIGTPTAEDDAGPRPAPPASSAASTVPPVPEEVPAEVPDEIPLEERDAVPVETVVLTDNDAGSAMFTGGTALAPGVRLDRCIDVTYQGTVDAGPVHLYAAATSGDLAPYLDLTIEAGEGEPGSFGSCTGFVPAEEVYRGTLADFTAVHPDFGTGLLTWEPAGSGEVRSFRFSVSVRDDPAAAGRSASFGFSWESRG